MATADQIKPLLQAQLSNDAHARLVAAGAAWATLPMGFYYMDEVSVDIGVKATMLRVLAFEHATLPDSLWANLGSAINRDTKVSDALDIMADISSGAVHHPLL